MWTCKPRLMRIPAVHDTTKGFKDGTAPPQLQQKSEEQAKPSELGSIPGNTSEDDSCKSSTFALAICADVFNSWQFSK